MLSAKEIALNKAKSPKQSCCLCRSVVPSFGQTQTSPGIVPMQVSEPCRPDILIELVLEMPPPSSLLQLAQEFLMSERASQWGNTEKGSLRVE